MQPANTGKYIHAALLCMSAVFISYTALGAETEDSSKVKKVQVLPVPTFGYTPETGSYIGAVALFTLNLHGDTLARTSNARLELTYTWRKQVITEAGWNYFFKKERWYSQGLLHYSRYPDLYYGIGEATAQSNEAFYESNRIVADVNFLKNIGNGLFLGPKVRYLNYYSLTYDRTKVYPELSDQQAFGIGYTILKDTRNNLLNATSGVYAELTNTYNFPAAAMYGKLVLDGRAYTQAAKNITLAGRFFNEFTAGTPPFFDYALTGGDKRARGYYFGRYRDRNLSTLQGEARIKVIGRFGVAVFGGIAKLYPDVRSLTFQNILPNYGGGIRFLVDRKQNINVRVDYARGAHGQDGFYISFGESF